MPERDQPNTSEEPEHRELTGPERTLNENDLTAFNLNLRGTNPEFHLASDDEFWANIGHMDLTRDDEYNRALIAIGAREKIQALAPEDQILPHPPMPERGELQTAAESIQDPDTGQSLNALKLNWNKSGPVTVFIAAFLSDVEKGPTNLRVNEVARQDPNHRLLALNPPSMGSSDDLTPEQRASIDHGEGFDSITIPMLQAMRAEGITDINLIGTSLGAAIASNMIAHAHDLGINVHEAILMEAPNTKRTWRTRLGLGMAKEAKYFDAYHQNPANPALTEATWLDKPKKERKRREKDLALDPLRHGRGRDTLLRFPKAMAEGRLEPELDAGLTHQPDLHITLVNGGESHISPSKHNNRVADHLTAGAERKGRVERVIEPGGKHSIFEEPEAYGRFIAMSLRET